jgi:hypothetical protein
MKTVYKYEIELANEVTLDLPVGAEVIKFDKDPNRTQLCIWCIVDTNQPIKAKTFAIRGTGGNIESNLWYLTSAIVNPFVWHLFEVV